ncbi:MAG: hypothetical protein ACK6CT_13455, partial [Planctomycetia bacterium]
MTAPRLAVVLGPCDDMRAEVFFRVPLPDGTATARVGGVLVGPECRRAVTLPATARVVDLGPTRATAGPLATAVGKAIVTEPAYWTPDLPALYRLDLHVEGVDAAWQVPQMVIGLRRFGPRRRSLWLDGRRWVPRGVACSAAELHVPTLRDAGSTSVLVEPDDPLLATRLAAVGAVTANAWMVRAEVEPGLPLSVV